MGRQEGAVLQALLWHVESCSAAVPYSVQASDVLALAQVAKAQHRHYGSALSACLSVSSPCTPTQVPAHQTCSVPLCQIPNQQCLSQSPQSATRSLVAQAGLTLSWAEEVSRTVTSAFSAISRARLASSAAKLATDTSRAAASVFSRATSHGCTAI